jgi:nucleoside-diphosphate-sugar epimerase
MNILITGGCGYVGSVLTQKLLDAGHRVNVVDLMWFGCQLGSHRNLNIFCQDVRNAELIDMQGIDVVIHLANIANDPCGDLNPKLSWEVNALAGMKLVEHAIKSGVKKFIYSSSGSVYGVKVEPEVTEELSLVPISDYNKTKMVCERVLLSYQDQIDIFCIRPATVCGYSPRMRLDLSVNMLTMQALTKGKITVWGGKQVRPNIHIQDLCRVFQSFSENRSVKPGVYNAGFENISILSIARRIAEFIPSEIVVTDSNDPRSYRLNSQKILSTGFQPRFGVDDGIREVIDAYEAGKIMDQDNCYNIKTMGAMESSALK